MKLNTWNVGRNKVIPQRIRQAIHDEWMQTDKQVIEIAEKHKINTATASYIIDEIAGYKIFKGKKRSEENELEMQKLFKQGISIPKIAKQFKVCPQTVNLIIGKIDYTPTKVIWYDDYTEEEMLATPPASENFLDYIAKMNGYGSKNLAQKLDTQFLSPHIEKGLKTLK